MTLLRSGKTWAGSFLTAALLTVLTTAQSYAGRRLEGLPASVDRILPIQAIEWFAWGALAPGIVVVAARILARTRARPRLVVSWAGMAVGFSVGHALIEVILARAFRVVPVDMPFMTMLPARVAETLVGSLMVVAALACSYYALEHYRRATQREQRMATLEAQLAEARLNALRSQLQPHFLFNTLHTISALVSDDTDAARRVITRLGDLLRVSMDTTGQHEVPLHTELAFMRHYLDIQQARFGERLRIRTDIDDAALNALVPAMILQPLVENCVRHAVEPRRTGGSIVVNARREGDTVILEVGDDGPGVGPTAGGGLGIGLANTRARLAQLYGDAHRFAMRSDPGAGVVVQLTLPLRIPSP